MVIAVKFVWQHKSFICWTRKLQLLQNDMWVLSKTSFQTQAYSSKMCSYTYIAAVVGSRWWMLLDTVKLVVRDVYQLDLVRSVYFLSNSVFLWQSWEQSTTHKNIQYHMCVAKSASASKALIDALSVMCCLKDESISNHVSKLEKLGGHIWVMATGISQQLTKTFNPAMTSD